jgi:hypothetical protein
LWNPLLHKGFWRLPVLASSGCLRSWCVPNVSPRRSTCPGLQSLVGPSVNRRPRRKHGAMISGRRPMIG